jgi:hypothetical protein
MIHATIMQSGSTVTIKPDDFITDVPLLSGQGEIEFVSRLPPIRKLVLDLARTAQRALRAMPTRDRERIIRALDEMKTDPLAGDITALRGEYGGLYRRRVGS